MPKKATTKSGAETTLAGHPTTDIIAVAKTALLELTTPDSFSEPPAVSATPGVVTVDFPNSHPGYPGWVWSISVNDHADMAPTVLELQMVPSTGALVSPAWVPWADRMEEFLAHEKEVADQALQDSAEDLDGDNDDDDDDDDVDFDGDVDGVDIDELDLGLDPTPRENAGEPSDAVDHVEFDEADPLDP